MSELEYEVEAGVYWVVQVRVNWEVETRMEESILMNI